MADTTDFLRSFMLDGGLLQLAVGTVDNAQYLQRAPVLTGIPEDKDVYFSPAQRRNHGSTKADVLGTSYLWVDVDDPVLPDCTFPPTAVVFSGNGNHLYWRLTKPVMDVVRIEQLNKTLLGDIPTADQACWNANRLMRVPGTFNVHRPNKPPAMAELRLFEPWSYGAEDVDVLGRLDERVRLVIRNGDADAWQSRSERDWFVVSELIVAGASDELITFLFDKQPVGDKYRDGDNGAAYLRYTVEKAREEYKRQPAEPGERAESKSRKERRAGHAGIPPQIVEKPDGYYLVGATARQLSTFTLEPKVLLEGIDADMPDALVCDVKVGDKVWRDETFSRISFNSVAAIDKALPRAAWVWMGGDAEIRLLLKFLVERMAEKQSPHVAATNVVGLHRLGVGSEAQWLYLGDRETLGAQDYWRGTEGPLTWLPVEREHPSCSFDGDPLTREQLDVVTKYLPSLNAPCPIWTMLGWHAAAVLKPWLEMRGFRFPILNITGTRGSGKTSLNKNVMMRLFSAQQSANVYDAATTRFVRMALLGSSNAVPVAFGEFRYESVEIFIRTVLLAYDGGSDARGRQDQTTQQWTLTAPFTVDGEDAIGDPAARERILLARLRPDTIDEGTPAWGAYKEFIEQLPTTFARHYVQTVLAAIAGPDADELLAEARREMFKVFPSVLPDRVRANYTVALFGMKLYRLATGAEIPDASVFAEGLAELVNMTSGRSRTLVDDFIEAIVNQVSSYGHKGFACSYDHEQGAFWFQMSSAHNWWLTQRKRQGSTTLQKDAIIAQLREAKYSIGVGAKKGIAMFGINLEAAKQYGLDIPGELGTSHVTIEF